MLLLQSDAHALARANEEACTLLLGSLIVQATARLQRIHEPLAALLAPDDTTTDGREPVAVFVEGLAAVLTVFSANQASGAFWRSLLTVEDVSSSVGACLAAVPQQRL